MYKRDWTTCTKYVNHFGRNNQCDKGNMHGSLDKHENLQFDIEHDIHMGRKYYETNDVTLLCSLAMLRGTMYGASMIIL